MLRTVLDATFTLAILAAYWFRRDVTSLWFMMVLAALVATNRLWGPPAARVARRYVDTPFRQALALLVAAYAAIDFGIPYVPPLLGINSAPVPNTVVLQYLITVSVGILLWVSDNEERWREFKKPIHDVMVLPERRITRNALFVIVPLLVAFIAFDRASPDVSAPPSFRVHELVECGCCQVCVEIALPAKGYQRPIERGSLSAHILALGSVPRIAYL